MKKLSVLSLLLMALCLNFTFTSCSDDDEGPGDTSIAGIWWDGKNSWDILELNSNGVYKNYYNGYKGDEYTEGTWNLSGSDITVTLKKYVDGGNSYNISQTVKFKVIDKTKDSITLTLIGGDVNNDDMKDSVTMYRYNP